MKVIVMEIDLIVYEKKTLNFYLFAYGNKVAKLSQI
jgi:hypothetical protein